MTTLEFDKAKIATDDGNWLCLRLPNNRSLHDARRFVFGLPNKLYDADLKEHREKRSLEANRYCWRLLGDMADVLRTSKEELYLQKIREVGVFQDFPLEQKSVKSFCTAWGMLGTGWPTEQVDYDQDGDRVVIRAYYGSSTYNTKQMSRLIDSIVEDCKSLGIETLPPDKIALLKEDWIGAPTN